MKIRILLLSIGLLAVVSTTTDADLTVTMTGTVNNGTLNGVSIDGQRFRIDALLVNPAIDSEIESDQAGFFSLSASTMEIIGVGDFIFEPNDLYFVQGFTASSFQIGFADSPTLANMDRNFGFISDTNLPAIDPNTVQPLSYSSFTGTFGPESTFTNRSGDTLEFNLFGDTTGASVTVVPEPNPVTCLFVGFIILIGWRYRRLAKLLGSCLLGSRECRRRQSDARAA